MVSNKVTLKKLTLQKKKISKSIINKKTHYNHEARKGWIKKKHSETNKEVFKINIDIQKWKIQ